MLVAAFSRHPEALAWAETQMASRWGAIGLVSPAFAFGETDYYTSSMGADLKKQFWLFDSPFDPGRLAEVKLATNALEAEYAGRGDHAAPRPLNLDPGYITLAKLVLATTKDHAHRVYLDRGIYAEVTLHFSHGTWRPAEWTFPDYRRADYHEFFNLCRQRLKR